MVYNILKNLNTFIKNNELIVEANENSPRNQLIKHFSTDASKEEDKQNIIKKVDLFFSLKKDGKLAGIKEKEKLDINWWIKNKKTFLDFDTFFDEFFNNPDDVSLEEYYLKYLKGKRFYDYNLVPKKIIQHLKNGEDFDGNPAECQVYAVQDLVKKGFSVAFEDANWQVIVPHNKWASIFFCKMNEDYSWRYASWCTGKFDKENNYNLFNSRNYTPYGFQYIVIDKKKRTKYNIQFSNHTGGNKQTEQNDTIPQGGYNVFPLEVIAAMFTFEDRFEANSLKQKNIKDFYATLVNRNYNKKDELISIPCVRKIGAYDSLTTFFKILPIDGHTQTDLEKSKADALEWYNTNKNNLDEEVIKGFITDNMGGTLFNSKYIDRIFKIQISILGLQEFFINTLLAQMSKREKNSVLTFSFAITDYVLEVLHKPELFDTANNIAIETGMPLPEYLDEEGNSAFHLLTPEQKDKYFIARFKKFGAVHENNLSMWPDSSILTLIKYMTSAVESYRLDDLADSSLGTKELLKRIICLSNRYKEIYEKQDISTLVIETDDEMNKITSNLSETEKLIQAFFKRALSTSFNNSAGVINHISFKTLDIENRKLFIAHCIERGLSTYSSDVLKILSKAFINIILVDATAQKQQLHIKMLKNADFNKELSDYIDMLLVEIPGMRLESVVPIAAASQDQLVKHADNLVSRGSALNINGYNSLSTESRQKYIQLLIGYSKINTVAGLLQNEPELFNETIAKYYFEKLETHRNIFHADIIKHAPKDTLVEYFKKRIDTNTVETYAIPLIPDELLTYYTEEIMKRERQLGNDEAFDRLNNINPDEAKKYVIYKINKTFTLSPNEKALCDDELLYVYYKNIIDNSTGLLSLSEFKKLTSDKLRPLKHRFLKSVFPRIEQEYFADTSNAVKEDILKRFVDQNIEIPRALLTVTPLEIQQKFIDTTTIKMQALTDEAFNGLDIGAKKTYLKNCIDKHVLITPHQLSKLSAGLQQTYLNANAGRFALSNDHFNVLTAENRLFYISKWLEANKMQLLTPGQMDWARKHTR